MAWTSWSRSARPSKKLLRRVSALILRLQQNLKPRALTYAACWTLLRLHMHLSLEHGVHAARRAATLQEGRVTFYNPKVEKKDAGTKSNTLKGSLRRADPSLHSHHTVLKDTGCGVHAIGKREHPSGIYMHSRMRHVHSASQLYACRRRSLHV